MKPDLQCAEQQVSRSNLTKYCACHAERLTYLIIITYETSFTVRGATGLPLQHHQLLHLPHKIPFPNFLENLWKQLKRHFQCGDDPRMIRPWPENDPTMIRPWNRQSATRLTTSIFYGKIQRSAPHLTFKPSPSAAPATKSDTRTSPSTAPATKSDTWPSPSTAPATKSDTWPSPSTAPATKSDTRTSPNTAPATKSNTWPSPSTAPATKSDTRTSPSTAPATKSNTRTWPSTAPATKSDTRTSPSTAPATKSDTHGSSSWHMKPHLQCAEQPMSPSKLTKYCACHAKWPPNIWQKFAENSWNVISNAEPIRP